VGYFSFFYEREQSLTFAFVLGLIRDILGQGVFGAMAFSFPIATILLIRLGGALNREKFYVQALALFGVTFLMLGCDLFVESAFYGQWMWLNRFSSRILYTSITTALAGPLVLSVMQKFLGSNPRQYELFA
jgi:rod shape-determining protein MreD